MTVLHNRKIIDISINIIMSKKYIVMHGFIYVYKCNPEILIHHLRLVYMYFS